MSVPASRSAPAVRRSAAGVFDSYVVVDWSAGSRPTTGHNSVWICALRREGSRVGVSRLTNVATRAGARGLLRDLLRENVRSGMRTLVGLDVAYGYPRGFAAALGLPADEPPWRAVWRQVSGVIEDHEDNANNRFAAAAALNARLGGGPGPFWGCPPAKQAPTLTARRRGEFTYPYPVGDRRLEQYRRVEERLRGHGRLAHPCWKLAGAGAVGSQTLLGIPVLADLRDDPVCSEISVVWPFETGLSADHLMGPGPVIVHAEVWPGAFDLDLSAHDVRDAAQVLSLARHLALLDGRGRLAACFEPANLGSADRRAVEREEGWMLGVR